MPSVLILGAGLAGLTAARALTAHGFQVTVLEKGRGVGGRLATRRIANGQADHGTPWFSATTDAFRQQTADWLTAGLIRDWQPTTDGMDELPDGPRQYIGVAGMNSLAKHLAEGLTVYTNERAIRLRAVAGVWQVGTESGNTYRADAVCCTIPAPQVLTLLADSEIDPVAIGVSAIADIQYQPTITVIAQLNKPTRMPAPGAIQYPAGPVARAIDNQQKGISPGPSVTLHASADFSRARLDYRENDTTFLGAELMSELMEWIDPSDVDAYQVHRWRYSLAETRYPEPMLLAETPVPLLFGGDGFGMGNVEGAFLSGRAMAQRLIDTTKEGLTPSING